jgi:hypothetical protein
MTNSHNDHRPVKSSLEGGPAKAQFVRGSKAWKKVESRKAANHRAQVLRKYARLCKAENVESDRVHVGPRTSKPNKLESETLSEKKNGNGRKERFEANSRARFGPRGDKNKLIEEQRLLDQQKRSKEKELEALRTARNEKRKSMQRKTKLGQPSFGSQVKLLLDKIKAEG